MATVSWFHKDDRDIFFAVYLEEGVGFHMRLISDAELLSELLPARNCRCYERSWEPSKASIYSSMMSVNWVVSLVAELVSLVVEAVSLLAQLVSLVVCWRARLVTEVVSMAV